MEENNKEQNQEIINEQEVQVSEPINTIQDENKEKKFTPLGEIKEKVPKKKKSKAGAIIVIILLLCAIIAGLAYYYFEIYTNPKVIYRQIISTGINKLAESPDEMTTIKTNVKLDMDVSLNQEYLQEDNVKDIVELINGIDAEIGIQMDTNEKKSVLNLNSNYKEEKLLNANMLLDAKNRGTYLKIEQFFDNVLEIEMEDEYYKELEESFEIEETLATKVNRIKAVKILNKELKNIIKDEYCSKEKEEIILNTKEINTDKYILKMTNLELINELKTVIENLKNNEEFLNCFEDKESIKQQLEELLLEDVEETANEEFTIYVKIYKSGLKQELVRIDFEVEVKEERFIFKVEKIEDTYEFELSLEEKVYFTGSSKKEKLSEKTAKTNLTLDIDEIGKIALNLEYTYITNEAIDFIETENAVKIDELTDTDTLKIYENFANSQLYKMIEPFFAGYDEFDNQMQPQLPNDAENQTTSIIDKNLSSKGILTEGGTFIVFAENNNTVPVDIEVEVEYYDAEGKFLGSSSDELVAVGAGREIAIQMWNVPSDFSTYKIYVEGEQTDETEYFDEIEMTHNNNGKNIGVQVKNKSEDKIEFVTVSVVYYKNGEIVGITDGIEADVKAGRSANFNIDFPYDSQYKDVEFDDYKVFVTEAYSYND